MQDEESRRDSYFLKVTSFVKVYKDQSLGNQYLLLLTGRSQRF